ncbi:MAG: T9SS type A sorting domain-containing protein [Hymenobacter sp.]
MVGRRRGQLQRRGQLRQLGVLHSHGHPHRGAALRHALEIYPNPAAETVQLRLPGVATARAATVEVLDALGRTVRQRPAVLSATDAVVLDLRGLPAGLYAVRVVAGGLEYTGRVVVQ